MKIYLINLYVVFHDDIYVLRAAKVTEGQASLFLLMGEQEYGKEMEFINVVKE